MQILIDSCLALLASIGLWTLCNMFFNCIFHKQRHLNSDNVITIQIIDGHLYCDRSIDEFFGLSHGHHTFLIDIDVY